MNYRKKGLNMPETNKQIFKKLFFYFSIILLIVISINLFQYFYELISLSIEKNISFSNILTLLFYLLPFLLSFSLQIPTMGTIFFFITLFIFKHKEKPHFKINKLSIFKKLMLFTLGITLLQLILFQWIVPWGNRNYVMTKYEIIRKNPVNELVKNKKFRQDHFEIRIRKADDDKNLLYDVKIVDFVKNQLFLSDFAYISPRLENNNKCKKHDTKIDCPPYFELTLFNPTQLSYIFRPVAENELAPKILTQKTFLIKDFDIKKIMPKGSELEGIIQLIQRIQRLKREKIANIIKTYHKIVKKEYLLMKINQKKSVDLQENFKRRIKQQISHLKKRLNTIKNKITPKNETYLLHRKLAYTINTFIIALLAFFIGMLILRLKISKGIRILISVFIIFFAYIFYNAIVLSGSIGPKMRMVSPEFGAWFPALCLTFFCLVFGLVYGFVYRKKA